MNKYSLIIFTEGHPNIDTGFILPELKVLSRYFKRITIYPLRWEKEEQETILPSNVFFSPDLANYTKLISSIDKKISGFRSLIFWKSLLKIKPSKYKSSLNTCGLVSAFSRWICKLETDKSQTIFYTYWLTIPAVALSQLKSKNLISGFVSRAHRFDLYNERGDYILNYFKPFVFKQVRAVYCISDNGKQYLVKHYPQFADKFKLSRLGTVNDIAKFPPKTKSFEVVSCSFLTPVKRIDLLIRGLACFQEKFPEFQIKWTHIGGGILYDSLLGFACNTLKPGSFHFTGNVSGIQIADFYAGNYYSCFINVSESEGLPVSIMEAQSYGIPVIATDVGGTSEIVNNQNGLLLKANPLPEEIAAAISSVAFNEVIWENKRKVSRNNWETNFCAGNNYKYFAENLLF